MNSWSSTLNALMTQVLMSLTPSTTWSGKVTTAAGLWIKTSLQRCTSKERVTRPENMWARCLTQRRATLKWSIQTSFGTATPTNLSDKSSHRKCRSLRRMSRTLGWANLRWMCSSKTLIRMKIPACRVWSTLGARGVRESGLHDVSRVRLETEE